MSVRIIQGDCIDVLRTLPDAIVHCCVTSPPYFGLRDYGVDGQMGLEPTPDEYIAGMVAVFREVRRVLRDDGTLWLNIGDSYATNGGPGWQGKNGQRSDRRFTGTRNTVGMREQSRTAFNGYKPKDLIGVPWMLAFALRADGWYLRQDIIWAKPNPMPESVTDRCTKSHEYLFLLSKSSRYYFDADAIKEPLASSSVARLAQPTLADQAGSDRVPGKTNGNMKAVRAKGNRRTFRGGGVYTGGQSFDNDATASNDSVGNAPNESDVRNKRSVWTIATQPFKEAHFATFPPALVEPCILAGTGERGCCPECGAPWKRITSKPFSAHDGETESAYAEGSTANRLARLRQAARERDEEYSARRETLGWEPTCDHGHASVSCTVLDPFGGAGTTGLVADRLQRSAILIELNAEYAAIARRRVSGDSPLFSEVAA